MKFRTSLMENSLWNHVMVRFSWAVRQKKIERNYLLHILMVCPSIHVDGKKSQARTAWETNEEK